MKKREASTLERLRRRAETALKKRPDPAAGALEHELRVHEIELGIQNQELGRLHGDLERARDRYRELYDAAPVGYLTTTRDGAIVAVNQLASSLLGAPPGALIGRRLATFVARPSQPVYRRHRRTVMAGSRGETCELTLEACGGKRLDLHLESTWVPASRGVPGEMKTVLIDTTGPRRLERLILEARGQLAHALRVRTLSEMAPALAHELAQPLMAIQSYAAAGLNVLGGRRGRADPVKRLMGAIATQAERVEHILGLVRRFVRNAPPVLEQQDLGALVRDVVELATPVAKEHKVRIEVRLDARVPPVPLETVGIQQILLNLVLNGISALAGQSASRRVLTLRTAVADGTARVIVQDRGPGLQAVIGQLFEPYFSTKAGGLGLGLSISRRIAEQHGGSLVAEPGRRRGATFSLSLPVEPRRENA